MANQPSSYPILCASFNQDASLFAIGTRDGFRIFDSNNGRLCYERALGAFNIVEMLFSSNLVAIVGAGEQPSLSPRRLCLFNTMSGNALRELNFLTSILAVRMNRKRYILIQRRGAHEFIENIDRLNLTSKLKLGIIVLVVLLQDKTYIYDINSLTILDTIDTVPNSKGICAFSPSLDGCFLALPASITKGSLLLYNVMELQLHCEIDAHITPLATMVLSSNGMYIATASEQGTMIRVHLVLEATKSYSFRRGSYPSTIFSLSFGPCSQVPEILVATSSSGSVHVFPLGFAINQRSSRRSGGFLGSIMPDSISDALDPANHHIVHNAVPAGIKSYAVIRKVGRVADASSETVACRITLSIITYCGYFQEYNLSLNNQNEFSRSLDREFNLLTAISNNDIIS
ncbi:autophagy-related protein 18b isoform X2 [Momordica charantia]|uniref:Autophagy-related protein 18b isoform X2 n=1 Tax=Momordica charantia TaxID=3673 RepID=A0A6J1DIS5_MOMCH|nr:autophagy-related protein 18b isoform X2 [Momordica charantia]